MNFYNKQVNKYNVRGIIIVMFIYLARDDFSYRLLGLDFKLNKIKVNNTKNEYYTIASAYPISTYLFTLLYSFPSFTPPDSSFLY